MDAEIAAALNLDSIRGMKVHPSAASRGVHETMDNNLLADYPETPPVIVSGERTPTLVVSGEGFSLLPLHAPSFRGDINSLLEEEWSIFLCVDTKPTRAGLTYSKPFVPIVHLLCLSKRVADSTPRLTEASLPGAGPTSRVMLGGDASSGASSSFATALVEALGQMAGHLND